MHQLRELLKPQMRCQTTNHAGEEPSADLIEQWIFQLNDHTKAMTDGTGGTPNPTPSQLISTIRLSIHDAALRDLFHPLVTNAPISGRPAVPTVVINECKLNESKLADEGRTSLDTSEKDSQLDSKHPQPTCVSIPSHVTLMDLIIELYSAYGLCRQHENLCPEYEGPGCSTKESQAAYFNLQELCRMPYRLWESWSKNQRPLLEPFIQTHLIPDLANITLEYLLGDESTISFLIDRKSQPTCRWRIPLRDWRQRGDPVHREYSPEFELEDGLTWRLMVFPNGNPTHTAVPNCVAGFLELRKQPTHFNITCQFKFRMVHPSANPAKSIWLDGTHTFTNLNFANIGFNELLTPATVDEWTHPSDGYAMVEVAAWKEVHQPGQ